MNQLQVFNHSMFGELPVLVVGGVEWFGGVEAAKALGFLKPHDALANHVDEEDSAVHGVGVQTGGKSRWHTSDAGCKKEIHQRIRSLQLNLRRSEARK